MNPTPGKAYFLPRGPSIGWQEIGHLSEDGFMLAEPDTAPVYNQSMFRPKSVSMTFQVKHGSYLEHRNFIRLMAGNTVRLPSLIHHGKKRPRNHTGRRRYQ